MQDILDVLLDTLLDTLKLLPFLFLTYLAMECLEHRLGEKTERALQKAGRFGPLLGGLLGVVPQCGFSAAASNFYAGRVITMGTLLAVYLSTSDEMLPIMLSKQTPVGTMLAILGMKAAAGIVIGFLVDLFVRRRAGGGIGEICEKEKCGCEEKGVFRAALRHTLSIAVFILLVSFAIHLVLHFVGRERIQALLTANPISAVFLSALVGLIPNCAASVAITELYLENLLGFGAMMAGLLVSAGVGLLVLFRMNRNVKENVTITAILYVSGVVLGGILELLHVSL